MSTAAVGRHSQEDIVSKLRPSRLNLLRYVVVSVLHNHLDDLIKLIFVLNDSELSQEAGDDKALALLICD